MTKEQIMDVERNNTAGYDFKTTHNPNHPIHKATEEEIMHGFVPALKTGEDAEEEIIELLNAGFEGKHEVKAERMFPNPNNKKWMNTGNMYIERSSRGKDSGLSTTESDFWIHTFYDMEGNLIFFVGFKTEILKEVLIEMNKTEGLSFDTPGGDDGTSRGAIPKVTRLLSRYFTKIIKDFMPKDENDIDWDVVATKE